MQRNFVEIVSKNGKTRVSKKTKSDELDLALDAIEADNKAI
jgi:hypothetical protein